MRTIINQIANFRWEQMNAQELQQVMILSAYAAQEFAESLRIALEEFPDSVNLQRMALGELETTNLRFEDYTQRGDHVAFLEYFIKKYGVEDEAASKEGQRYLDTVRALPAAARAASIFSREQELPRIFTNLLSAPDWNAPGLDAFQYFLERHVELDSEEGGHGDLVEDLPIDESVKRFWKARRDMYTCIPSLYE